MLDLQPYIGPTKLVLALDIGTTYSNVSYSILEPYQIPEVLTVARFPAQGVTCADTEVPSLLYYDKSGTVRAAGAQVFAQDIVETALTEGWTKAEWWKLHLCPEHLMSSLDRDDDLPPLPLGKSAVDILADFIKYLFDCSKTYIQERHPAFAWSSLEDSIEYIFTYPGGWDEHQCLYFRAIQRAGLVPRVPEGQLRVHMMTEGEAGLHFCISHLLNGGTANPTTPQGVVMIDAGGGIIGLSMFSITYSPIVCQEIAPAESRPKGSVFVTRHARALIERKLKDWEHSSPEDIDRFTREFDHKTKNVIESDQRPAYIRGCGRRTNSSRHCISSGQLKLSGEEATNLFDESINAIVGTFQSQYKLAATPIKTAFLVGGLSTNDWVWSRLQSYFTAGGINICRPDRHTNKAVANGAVLSYMYRKHHSVASKVARLSYDTLQRNLWRAEAEKEDLEKTLETSNNEAAHLRQTVTELHAVLCAHEQKHQCEALYAQGRIQDAAEALLKIVDTSSEAVRTNELIVDWVGAFTHRCVSKLEIRGDQASHVKKHDEAVIAYSAALSLSRATPITVFDKWARIMLLRRSASEVLGAAAKFKLPKSLVFRAICDVLEEIGRVTEAISCYRQIESELGGDTTSRGERTEWELGFQRRCVERLSKLGDEATNSQMYSQAEEHFSTILSLNPPDRINILVKRNKVRVSMNSWDEALNDANEAIKLDPSCYLGHEMKHAALHGAGHYGKAVKAFAMMLSKLDESPDVNIRQIRDGYVDAVPKIRRIVQEIIGRLPRILIDTTTGRVYDRQQQADAFEALPIFSELVSSMTTQLDLARIREAVKEFYQYVTLSHRWKNGEPLLQQLDDISVYGLEASPPNTKLKSFCLLVRDLGFRWAWSDNSCVDKSNNVILQESMVAMFTWYHDSALTVVYLCDVSSESQQPGDLWRSIWNTRVWTYQEYVAAKVIRFYTKDWKPYLGLTMYNQKEAPSIIFEMQQATGVSAEDMAMLGPGLNHVRVKLYLASRRETTLVEDIAYSLFGIFNAPLPVIYGEGNRAVGRLLEYVLTGSSDATILAWTGTAGSYNSCLPLDLTVYNPLVPPHVPQPIEKAKMDRIITRLRSSLSDYSLLNTLRSQLNDFPSPSLAANRLRLPGIVFPLVGLIEDPESDPVTKCHVYRATTPTFGDVKIRTGDNLTGMEGLILVHPWIRPLLDQEFSEGATALDETTQGLRLLARLRQPFGALLFVQMARVEYKRVAADSLIMVQFREGVSLTQLIDAIRTIEVQ